MRITVFGTGYVGLVVGTCLAEIGHEVICLDVDAEKIKTLNAGKVTFYEPGLEELIARNIKTGKLQFSLDSDFGIEYGEFLFIAVGTPATASGEADLSSVFAVADQIAERINEYKIIITKSTVPLGTEKKITQKIVSGLAKRNLEVDFDVVSNPEFLREGRAVEDFLHPDRIVVGADTERAFEKMKKLYAPFIEQEYEFLMMSPVSAELSKYVANAFLATKISFMNEMSHIAESYNADLKMIKRAISLDHRISEHFLNAGCGYGGSCFPKDVKALTALGRGKKCAMTLMDSVNTVNERQKIRLFEKINEFFSGELKDKVIACWGLAFKPETDDIREAPSLVVIDALLRQGAKIQAYDPVAMPNVENYFGEQKNLMFMDRANQALEGADVLVIFTEWNEFKTPNYQLLKSQLKYQTIFDGRNIYDADLLAEHGLNYYGIGKIGRRLLTINPSV